MYDVDLGDDNELYFVYREENLPEEIPFKFYGVDNTVGQKVSIRLADAADFKLFAYSFTYIFDQYLGDKLPVDFVYYDDMLGMNVYFDVDEVQYVFYPPRAHKNPKTIIYLKEKRETN